jgi:TP901 family phage tail tape measure protein
MAQRFNLTAQLQLQANSSNINQVVSQLKKQLAPLGNVQLNVQANTKSLAQANQQMATFNANAKTAAGSMGDFNRSLAESARRFSVITVATGSLLSLVNAFKKSTSAAIDFEYEMVKISQTTGQTMREVGAMSNEIRKLSTSLGVSSAELAGTARILLQAGLSADKTRKSLDILAKTTLSASFDDLQSTTEGAIALINQFRGEAARAGGDVKFLEQSLDSINAVSKAFAVESADLVDVIRKVGGVFSNAGGSVNELISLFTSVRATTRESAETIGTGLRTIFTRIQRGDTVDALKELGIELRNSQGQFVGAFEAVKRLSEGLSSLDPRDFRFAAIVEELGGYRQIGKVIPLINQFTIAQQALNIAQSASGSVAADAQTSQQALAVQINKTKEKFNEFIANLVGSDSFRSIITGALKLADAFINIGKALEPVLPLLTTLFALKAGQGLASGIGILRGFAGAPSGIRASKFASGGLVPGSGNRDTVPAMLTPGEFVIRKSSVNKLGAGTLAQMNANGYAAGGIAKESSVGIAVPDIINESLQPKSGQVTISLNDVINKKTGFGALASKSIVDIYGIPTNIKAGARDTLISRGKMSIQDIKDVAQKQLGFTQKTYSTLAEGIGSQEKLAFDNIVNEESKKLINSVVQKFGAVAEVRLQGNEVQFSPQYQLPQAQKGNLFEDVVDAFNGQPLSAEAKESNRPFDFTNGVKTGKLFRALQAINYVDAKVSGGSNIAPNEFEKKTQSQLASDLYESYFQNRPTVNDKSTVNKKHFGGLIQKFNKGSSGTGVKPSNYPLVDDILENAKGAILPNPKNIEDIIKAGGGALDVDRTLIRTIGDKAYAQAKTEKAKEEVLKKYFVGAGRLQDIKSSPLTQFGKTLQSAIQNGQINPNNLKIITKSRRVDGVGEYLNQLFGIPLANMIFTQGGSKQPALDAFNTKGSRAQRVVKRASGGGISGSDTVPAMLTPGEFVVSKSAAQSIGYTNLNRMNKHGVTGYARGGVVGVQKFAQGGVAQQLDQLRGGTGAVSQLSIKEFAMLKQAAIKNTSAFEQLTGQLSGLTDVEAVKAALKGFTRNVDKVSDDTELVSKSMQSANKAIGRTEDANEQLARRLEQQQASDARKTAGTSEARAAGSVTVQTGNFNQVQKDAVYASGMFKAMGLEGQQLKDSFARYRMFVKAGWTSQDALNQVIRNTTTEQQALNQSLAKKRQEQRKEFLGAPKYTGVGLGDKDSRAGFAQRGGEIAGSMQNFAFLGASVAAVTSQLGLFGDTTNKAIAETAGFTVGLVGIVGTLAQTLTSFGANSLAVQANTTSITQNTAAQKGAAAANALGLVVIAAVAAVSALKFLSSQNKESAEAISKDRDARLKSAAETGVSNFKPGELQAGLEQELEMRQRSAEQMSASSLKTVASFTAAGAGVGFLLGGPFGAAIGGAIGAAAGLGTALLDSESAVMEAAEARRREVEAIGKVYESYLQLSASSYKLSSTLNAIESTPGLSNQDKLERRMEAIATSSAGNDALRAGTLASNQLKTSAGRLGVTTEAASAMSPEEIAAAAKKNNPDLGEGDIADIQASVKASVATLKASADETARQIQETGKNLNDAAANLDLSGTTNAAQKTVAAYNQAIEAYVQSLERERDFKLSQVNSQDKNAVDAVNKESQIKINAAYAGRDATIKAKMAEAEANQRAVAAQIAMAEAARRTAVFLDSLADEKDTIKARSEALKDFTDTLSGGIVDLSTAIKPIRNIEEPSKITDAAKFSRQVQGVAQVSGSPEAQKAADELTNVAKLFEQANKSLIGKTFELEESIDAEKILKDIGLTPEALGGGELGKAIFQQIAVTLRDQKTPITPEVLDKILAPLAERAKDSASIINEIQSVQQEEINLRQQQIQAEQMLREEQLSAISKYNSAVSSGSEALARATGQSVAAVRARNELESRQRTLNAGQASRGGRFLNATDPAQLAREKKAAQARTIEIINEIARLKQLGNTVKDLDGQLSKLQAEQAQLANVTKDASAALEEIASSGAEIDRLTEALDKERQVREQAFSVLKEFVAGGDDARSAITSGAMGVLSAIQTGTTQNLSEEQRSQTFGLLDKLKDVMIAGTGLTGGQIANELVFRDAVRLGFPPDIAKELATQTTTEELILQELRTQTKLQAIAAKVPASNLNTQAGSLGFSKGGVVYRADGGSIQSKGTDTVPAMLTPGEYVVNARSAAKNMPLLKAINRSKGGSVIYRANGSNKKEDELIQKYPDLKPYSEWSDAERQFPGLRDLFIKMQYLNNAIESPELQNQSYLQTIADYYGNMFTGSGIIDNTESFPDVTRSKILSKIFGDGALKEQLRNSLMSYSELSDPNDFFSMIDRLPNPPQTSGKRMIGEAGRYKKLIDSGFVDILQPLTTKMFGIQKSNPDFEEVFAGVLLASKNISNDFKPKVLSRFNSEKEKRRLANLAVKKNKDQLAKYGVLNDEIKLDNNIRQNQKFKDAGAYKFSSSGLYVTEDLIRNYLLSIAPDADLGERYDNDPEMKTSREKAREKERRDQAARQVHNQIAAEKSRNERMAQQAEQAEESRKQKKAIEKENRMQELAKEAEDTRDVLYSSDGRKIKADILSASTSGVKITKVKRLDVPNQPAQSREFDVPWTDLLSNSRVRVVEKLNYPFEKWTDTQGILSSPFEGAVISADQDAVRLVTAMGELRKLPWDRLNDEDAKKAASSKQSKVSSSYRGPILRTENGVIGNQGAIYKAAGGTIFKPRGTDTVPAMLTPGEFVIRKSAVDKIGVSNLAAINNGNTSTVNKAMGGPIYRAAGGPVTPIGAATATTTGAGPLSGINLISGASYTSMMQRGIAALAQSGQLTKFAKDLNSSDKDIKDLIFLIRSGKFQSNRFLAAETKAVADFMNGMNSGAGAIFSEINASGSMLNPEATVETIENWVKKSLADITTLKAYKKIQYSGWGLLTEAALGTKGPIDTWEDVIASVQSYVATVKIPPGKTKTNTAVGFGADVSTKDQINARDAGMGLSTKERDAVERLRASGFYFSGGGLVYMQSGGRAKYFNEGGNPADTIPAMLTPGEFVMSPEAVNKFGVGYMKSLNKGQVPGFRRGGLVGGVNYLGDGGIPKSGGGFSFNFNGIQSIFDSFSGDFKSGLDNIITAFSSFGGIVGSLVSALSAGMNVVHQFSGDMTLAFNIQNGDVLKNQIAEAITPKLKEIITRELDARLDNINFKAGGS